METVYEAGAGSSVTVLLPAHTPPWNATIENTMADFARVTAAQDGPAEAPSGARVQPS